MHGGKPTKDRIQCLGAPPHPMISESEEYSLLKGHRNELGLERWGQDVS